MSWKRNFEINISIKKWNKLFTHSAQPISDIHTKILTQTSHIHSKMPTFQNGREVDGEVDDGFLHAEVLGNKHFEAFLLDKLM